jgi:hypothetical protein
MRHLSYKVRYSVVPINCSPLTVRLHSSVITTQNIRSLHDVVTEFDGICGRTGMVPLIFNPDTRWRSVVIFAPRLLHVWRSSPRHPLSRTLDGYRTRVDGLGKVKTLPRRAPQFLGFSGRSLATILSTLYRLTRNYSNLILK